MNWFLTSLLVHFFSLTELRKKKVYNFEIKVPAIFILILYCWSLLSFMLLLELL